VKLRLQLFLFLWRNREGKRDERNERAAQYEEELRQDITLHGQQTEVHKGKLKGKKLMKEKSVSSSRWILFSASNAFYLFLCLCVIF